MRTIVVLGALAGTLAFGVPAASAVPLAIEGTPGPDTIGIYADSPTSGRYVVNDGPSVLFAGVTSVTVNAGAGDDRIAIGNPSPALFAPPLGIRVNGGDGVDTTSDFSGTAAAGMLEHGADGPDTKTITHVGGPPQKIVVESVANVEDRVADRKWTYRGTAGHDDVGLADGGMIPTSGIGWRCCYPAHVTNTGEDVQAGSKSSVLIDTMTSDSTPDTVNLTGYQPIAPELVVDDGLPTPEDVVHLGYHPGLLAPDLQISSDVKVRAARVDGAGYFGGTSLGLQVAQISTASGALDTSVDKLEVQSMSDVTVRNDRKLQVGGVSQDLSGVRSSAGRVSIDTSGKLVIGVGDEVKGNDITLTSDQIDNAARIAAVSAGTVRLRPSRAGAAVGLGAPNDPAGAYNVSDAELHRIDAGRIEVGAHSSGLLTVSAPVSPRADLSLVSGGGFTGTLGSAIQAPSLAFVDGSGTGRTWTIDPTSVRISPGDAIPYAPSTALAFQGGSGADAFTVKASPLVPYSIDGGGPGTDPGDTLSYLSQGRTVSGDTSPPDGRIDSPNVKPVFFDAFEALSIVP